MISIIIATYNSEATLARCLESLRAQQGADFEVLVSDGASHDATLQILTQNSDLLAWLTSGPDEGVYDAWNKAIPKARGEWILFLGSDDWLDAPDTLARLDRRLARIAPVDRQLSFVFGQTALMDAGQEIEWLGRRKLPGGLLDPDGDIGFSHTGLVHHRSLFEQLGLYDPAFRSAGDYEFMLRAALNPRARFRHLHLTVARMASGGMSNGAASRVNHYREMETARIRHGLKPRPGWLRKAWLRAAFLLFLDRHAGPRVTLAAANLYRSLRGKRARGTV